MFRGPSLACSLFALSFYCCFPFSIFTFMFLPALAKATRRRSATTRTPNSDATNRPTNRHNKHNRSRASSCSTVHVRASKMRQMPIFPLFFHQYRSAPKLTKHGKCMRVRSGSTPKRRCHPPLQKVSLMWETTERPKKCQSGIPIYLL